MTARLEPAHVTRLLAGVEAADAEYRRTWPGTPATRQPVHVLYVPADRITATTAIDAGAEARRLLDTHAPDAAAFAAAFSLADSGSPDGAAAVRDRVVAKLTSEPVEDLRVDFEDGYVGRDDVTEDRDAEAAARAVAAGLDAGTLPPFAGLRTKPFTDGLARRSVATLDRFLGALLDAAGRLPDGFVVTFPKIVHRDHVAAFADVLVALEQAHGLPEGRLRFEVQIETTPSLLAADGRVALQGIRDAAGGRLSGAHLGVYDYSAALGLPPDEQRLGAPALDFVRQVMQATFAGTEVRLSDGSTNAVPADDSSAEVLRVWARHAADVRHSLRAGFPQGWDLHPAHLVSRHTVVFAAALAGIDDVLDRLGRWARGEIGGGVLDEPATVRALRARVQRAVDCGALGAADIRARTGVDIAVRPGTL